MDNFVTTFRPSSTSAETKSYICRIVKGQGRRVLLVYGGGSIKKDRPLIPFWSSCPDCQISGLTGVEPNPRIESVRQSSPHGH